MEDSMFRTIRPLLFSFCMVTPFISVQALHFSSDTISAFDGAFWNGNSGDDSIMVVNNSDQAAVIDSIIFEVDTTGYEQFSISWMMEDTTPNAHGWGNRIGFYTVTDSRYTDVLIRSGDYFLDDYHNGSVPKMTIGPNDSIKMYSPYFSPELSSAGSFVECSGGCIPPGSKYFYRYFPGCLIFVSQGQRDTLHLSCELFWWEPPNSIVATKPGVARSVDSPLPLSVDLQGKVVGGRRPCSAGVTVQKGRVLHRIPGQYRR